MIARSLKKSLDSALQRSAKNSHRERRRDSADMQFDDLETHDLLQVGRADPHWFGALNAGLPAVRHGKGGRRHDTLG